MSCLFFLRDLANFRINVFSENIWSRLTNSCETRMIAIKSMLECAGSFSGDDLVVSPDIFFNVSAAQQIESLTLWVRAVGR